jgi:hypothetical protein
MIAFERTLAAMRDYEELLQERKRMMEEAKRNVKGMLRG